MFLPQFTCHHRETLHISNSFTENPSLACYLCTGFYRLIIKTLIIDVSIGASTQFNNKPLVKMFHSIEFSGAKMIGDISVFLDKTIGRKVE